MRTIDDYMDAAKNNRNLKSDRQLATELGITQSNTSNWRQKKSWPADHTMKHLAEIANVNPAIALIELNIWRSRPEAAEIYRHLLSKLPKHQDAA